VRRFKDCDVLDYLHWVTLPVYDGLIPQLSTGRYIIIGDTYESYSIAYALGMPIRVSRFYKVANLIMEYIMKHREAILTELHLEKCTEVILSTRGSVTGFITLPPFLLAHPEPCL
jgi:hypothetical protein